MPAGELSRRLFLAGMVGLRLARICDGQNKDGQNKNVVVAQPENVEATPNRSTRKALVIGNTIYPGSFLLRLPGTDARKMADALKKVGFRTELLFDLRLEAFESAVGRFVDSLHRGDEALFYYSGHAFQAGEQNYICPFDFDFQTKSQSTAFPVPKLAEIIRKTQAEIKILILDGCREFVGQPKPGLAALSALNGEYIALATQPGTTAPDDGLFAQFLADEIAQPAQEIDQVFKSVRRRLAEARKKELPPVVTWSGLSGPFYFLPPVVYMANDTTSIDVVPPFRITRNRVSLDHYHKVFPGDHDATSASDRQSVINIPWVSAEKFCRAVRYGHAGGPHGSLCTEAQLTAAFRHPGVFGTSDGVGEWCNDLYRAAPDTNPMPDQRVIRGLAGTDRRDRGVQGHLVMIRNKRGDLVPLNVGFRVVFPAS